MESEENQKNGIVAVYFGALPTQPSQHSANTGIAWELPIFFAGIHCCINSMPFYLLVSIAIFRLPLNLRPRIRVHYGSCSECLYKLSSFGIAREAVLTDRNEPTLDHHLAWCHKRQELELKHMTEHGVDGQSVTSKGANITPRPADVLFGPGFRLHTGNLVMKNLILGVLDTYTESRKGVKVQLTERVIDEIKKIELKKNKKNWKMSSLPKTVRLTR